MELRHWLAFGLIAVVAVTGSTAAVIAARRRSRRRLRMRGIKTYEHRRASGSPERRSAG